MPMTHSRILKRIHFTDTFRLCTSDDYIAKCDDSRYQVWHWQKGGSGVRTKSFRLWTRSRERGHLSHCEEYIPPLSKFALCVCIIETKETLEGLERVWGGKAGLPVGPKLAALAATATFYMYKGLNMSLSFKNTILQMPKYCNLEQNLTRRRSCPGEWGTPHIVENLSKNYICDVLNWLFCCIWYFYPILEGLSFWGCINKDRYMFWGTVIFFSGWIEVSTLDSNMHALPLFHPLQKKTFRLQIGVQRNKTRAPILFLVKPKIK